MPLTPTARRTALTALATTVATAACAAPALAGKPNDDPGFLNVYDNNIENLLTPKEQCAGDWTTLIDEMAKANLRPDLFLVQQLSGAKQADTLVRRMTRRLGEPYAYRIAAAKPSPPQKSPCGKAKVLQTNAIVYRVGRLTPKSEFRWKARARKGCKASRQARTLNLGVTFADGKRPGADVTAASIHWATSGVGGHLCTRQNGEETGRLVSAPPSALRIIGGDVNVTLAKKRDWYGALTQQHGFADSGLNATGRDFLFAKPGGGALGPQRFSATSIIPFVAGRPYSEHPALHARVHYAG